MHGNNTANMPKAKMPKTCGLLTQDLKGLIFEETILHGPDVIRSPLHTTWTSKMGMKPYVLLENKFQDINCSTDHIVLEIGSERGEGSSVWLHNWAKHRGMEFYSVDIDETAKHTVNNPDINFQVAESGSMWCKDVLPTLNKKIKVLYLDNFDWIHNEWKDNLPPFLQNLINKYASRGVIMNNENSQNEHFLQIQYCLPYLDEESIVIVDDTYYDFPSDTWDGKCAKVMPFLAEHGYVIEGNAKYGKWACKKCSYFEGENDA